MLLLAGVFVAYPAEQGGNPILAKLGFEPLRPRQPGGNMEGKEVRFGIAQLRAVRHGDHRRQLRRRQRRHDSFTPLGGLVPLFNIMTGEVVFGGVGAGLYGMLLFGILAVFIAGLMVGRTPEYLGKKIEQKEVKMVMLAVIADRRSILVFTAFSSASLRRRRLLEPAGPAIANMNNSGPHGFSEILYAYSSGAGNNGSAFGGLSANTPWYNLPSASRC